MNLVTNLRNILDNHLLLVNYEWICLLHHSKNIALMVVYYQQLLTTQPNSSHYYKETSQNHFHLLNTKILTSISQINIHHKSCFNLIAETRNTKEESTTNDSVTVSQLISKDIKMKTKYLICIKKMQKFL